MHPVPPADRADVLDDVYRRLAIIHAAINERIGDDDNPVVPWAEREIMGVLEYIQAAKKGGAVPTATRD